MSFKLGRVTIDKGRLITKYNKNKFVDEIIIPNHLKGSSTKIPKKVCIDEMSEMLDCLSRHEFADKECVKELAKYRQCYQSFQTQKQQIKEQENDPNFRFADGKPTKKQMNKLFAQWPQHNDPKFKLNKSRVRMK